MSMPNCLALNAMRINKNFFLTNFILSLKSSFTIEDVINRLADAEIDINANEVKKAVQRLRDNDYLNEIGCTYSIIPDDDVARRW